MACTWQALQQAATWYDRKRQLEQADSGDVDRLEYMEWKAGKEMETYLLRFMQANMNIEIQ